VSDLVIRSHRTVLPDGMRPASILVRDGRIAAIASHDAAPVGVRRLDADERIVLPGVVDTHVHMNDPGRAHWEGVDHATRAAAAGGVTTLIDMPLNSIPPTTTLAGLEAKRDAVRGRSHVDVGFWGGVVPGNTDDLEALARAGVLGFKCFLAPSGVAEFEHVSEADLRRAMRIVQTCGLPLLAHAESPEALLAPHGDPRRYATWLESRPCAAEIAAIELLIALAQEFATPVHVVHLACADPLPMLRAARTRGVRISVETCPHYLTFTAEDIRDGNTAVKCAPPVRERAHREGLWQGLLDADIDLIASDHSPSPAADKHLDDGDFLAAWGGIASLQIGLPAVWSGARSRGIPGERVASWMAAAPAQLAGIASSKGSISVGKDADLVIYDPDAEWTVDPSRLHHRHPVSPYAGMTLRGRVETTMLRGEIIFDEDRVLPRTTGRMIGSAS
jgi:allantoinase